MLRFVLLYDQETALAKKQYHDSCVIVQETITYRLNEMLHTGRLIAESYINMHMGRNMWPNATIRGFEMFDKAEVNARAVSFNPVVYDEDRASWERYAIENYDLLHASLYDDNLLLGVNNTWRLHDGIFETGNSPGSRKRSSRKTLYVPVWQIAPLHDNFRAINFDLFSETKRHLALEHVIDQGDATLTAFVHLVQDSSIGKDRPSSILFYPVKADFNPKRINGTTSVVFSWDDLLKNVLPSFVSGIQIVIRTSGGRHLTSRDHWTYTLELLKGNAVTLGRADSHDKTYNEDAFVVKTQFDPFNKYLESLVTYTIELYPSKELYDSYRTNAPIITCIITVSMVIGTSLIFIVYDFLYKKRIDSLAHTASVSSSIVNSLFPRFVRDKMFSADEHKSVSASILSHLRKNYDKEEIDVSGDAVAQSFQLGTVLFADIAGFTAWASDRPPKDVFHFLESLYQKFDEACKRNRIFKVETIGDCYMCVTGVPDEGIGIN